MLVRVPCGQPRSGGRLVNVARHSFGEHEQQNLEFLVAQALAEDLGEQGDHHLRGDNPRQMPVAQPGWSPDRRACSPGCLPSSSFPASSSLVRSGNRTWPTAICLEKGSLIGHLVGPMRSLLAIERTALNFLQRLSGIASLTARYVAAVARHARDDPGHPQDNPRLAFSREIRGPLRRRVESPFRPL